ncbi:hypothetical protein BD410DRAFT_282953 [Rickenella mellea]|uniref:Zn(2)-C6 fungal-type domain-containing protein n=1 Tax=Rickenella mellea TaxID=50990 RepID=A0A4Y7Q2K1_9AGAM|nr:hypothetical protein BD410DRAFT_282953 [Rickenella mellea]
MSSQEDSIYRPLHRGKACLYCRRRKTKCDGAKPTCRSCRMAGRLQECEYTDQGPALTQVLEDEVDRLKARIYDLEHPTDNLPVTLHNPHAAYLEAQTRRTSRPDIRNQPNERHSSSSGSVGSLLLRQMHPEVSRMLVTLFVERGELTGFALDKSRFYEQFNLPASNPNSPHPALLSSIYVWAFRLLNSNAFSGILPLYVNEAKRALASTINHRSSHARIQAIQSQVLLAAFFYSNGRVVEGHYHATGAVTMSFSAGLHRELASSAGSPSSSPNLAPGTMLSIPPPRDAIEAAERTRLFWAVYTLDACWSVAAGSSSNIREGGNPNTTIKTPWPLSNEEFRSRSLSQSVASGNIIQEFLSNPSAMQGGRYTSSITLRAQASVLLKLATRLGESSNSDDTQRGMNEFRDMARFVSSFIDNLPSINGQSELESVILMTNLVTRSLAHTAEIHLHVGRLGSIPGSLTACVNSALAILDIMEHIVAEESDLMDPAIVVSWTAAARIFVWNGHGAPSSLKKTCNTAASRLRSSLTAIIQICPMMETQVRSVLDVLSGN